jgi:hypothetical protein
MHQRQVIRQAVISQLLGKTAAGARVTSTKVERHKKGELPAISVYTLSESVDAGARPRELSRELAVEVAAWAEHSETYPIDNQLDDLAKQIEAAIDADPYLGDACGLYGAKLADTEVTIRDEGDPLIGIIALTYTVPYVTSPDAPVLDDFNTANATTQIVGAGSNNTVSDVIDVNGDP